MVHATVPARAGLAGNPSDGYGGAVLAVPVPEFAATVTVEARPGAPDIQIGEGLGVDGASLLRAAARRVANLHPGVPTGVRIEADTTIPRSVGLAGSSALIIATIEALAARWNLDLDADVVATTALTVEVEDLGIAAGLQDRICQTRRTAVFMDFAGDGFPAVREVHPPRPIRAFVAWTAAGSGSSGVVHDDLRRRWIAGDGDVTRAMRDLAAAARLGADALVSGDLDAVGESMAASLRLRESIVDVGPAMRTLIADARQLTDAVNSAGSGGAVVGLLPAHVTEDDLREWSTSAHPARVFEIR